MPGGSRYPQGNIVMSQVFYLPGVVTPDVLANATATQNTTVLGARVGDLLLWNQQSNITGLSMDNAYVSAKDVITMYWSNTTAGNLTGNATQAFLIAAFRPENIPFGITNLPNRIE